MFCTAGGDIICLRLSNHSWIYSSSAMDVYKHYYQDKNKQTMCTVCKFNVDVM